MVGRALEVMRNGSLLEGGVGPNDGRGIVSLKSSRSPELNRLRSDFGMAVGNTTRFTEDIMASIRETAQRGSW